MPRGLKGPPHERERERDNVHWSRAIGLVLLWPLQVVKSSLFFTLYRCPQNFLLAYRCLAVSDGHRRRRTVYTAHGARLLALLLWASFDQK